MNPVDEAEIFPRNPVFGGINANNWTIRRVFLNNVYLIVKKAFFSSPLTSWVEIPSISPQQPLPKGIQWQTLLRSAPCGTQIQMLPQHGTQSPSAVLLARMRFVGLLLPLVELVPRVLLGPNILDQVQPRRSPNFGIVPQTRHVQRSQPMMARMARQTLPALTMMQLAPMPLPPHSLLTPTTLTPRLQRELNRAVSQAVQLSMDKRLIPLALPTSRLMSTEMTRPRIPQPGQSAQPYSSPLELLGLCPLVQQLGLLLGNLLKALSSLSRIAAPPPPRQQARYSLTSFCSQART